MELYAETATRLSPPSALTHWLSSWPSHDGMLDAHRSVYPAGQQVTPSHSFTQGSPCSHLSFDVQLWPAVDA